MSNFQIIRKLIMIKFWQFFNFINGKIFSTIRFADDIALMNENERPIRITRKK